MLEIALLRFSLNDDEPVLVGEWQSAQKEIVDQTEDRGVHSNPEREGNDREKGEAWGLKELADSEAEISHGACEVGIISGWETPIWLQFAVGYSSRSAIIGLIFVTRSAGHQSVVRPTNRSTPKVARSVTGSCGETL